MALAAEALRIPVVSGNVSLYNETDGRAITPAPVVGCVGLVPDVRTVPGRWREGDAIVLAAAPELSFAGSEYQALWGQTGGHAANLDLAAEITLIEFLWRAAPLLSLAHDASAGGAAVALAQAALWSGVGADLELDGDELAWFGEGGGQAVVACAHDDLPRLGGLALTQIGEVGGDRVLGVKLADLGKAFD
jgi:phosphoribosylformylglycinamidine synthase